MRRIFAVVLLLTTVGLAGNTRKEHVGYVPDKKTAGVIGDAVLVAVYGEARIAAGRPLFIDGSNKDYWIVEVREKGPPSQGGGPAVSINKHLGCIQVIKNMK